MFNKFDFNICNSNTPSFFKRCISCCRFINHMKSTHIASLRVIAERNRFNYKDEIPQNEAFVLFLFSINK